MRGEFIGVWSETWREIWATLAKHQAAPKDLFCELYRELVEAFVAPPDVTPLAEIVDSPEQARSTFRRTKASSFRGELVLLEFLERAHKVTMDLGGDDLSNRYFVLMEAFLEKYSLRYDLRRPFSLHPTLAGVFARLMRELKKTTSSDATLHALMIEFEDTVRDLKTDQSSGRIKTCIHKQMNLLEAIAGQCPGVTAGTLGDMCNQVDTWPHVTVREAMKKLYGFASNYPGIRHAGNPSSALRDIEMRDMVAVTVVLAGFAPYLAHLLNYNDIYSGA
jgi:hypothetical protein